jgi:hypothetical protein
MTAEGESVITQSNMSGKRLNSTTAQPTNYERQTNLKLSSLDSPCQARPGASPLSWSDEFEDPLPGFRTLHDAANYIQKLAKAQQQLPHWQPPWKR